MSLAMDWTITRGQFDVL